ncbi:hypothetical protein KC324_g14480, partial [Hortaea werneckii]
MATKPSPTEGIMHPDRPTTIAMPIVDFRPTSFPDKPIAMYTAHAIRLAPEPTDEEDVQDQKSPGEKEMKPVLKAVLDRFKREFLPMDGTVLDVDGRSFVSFQNMRLGGERKYRVTGAVYDGSGRPDGMGVWERICL